MSTDTFLTSLTKSASLIDLADQNQFRFAILLNTEVENITNTSLYRAFAEWLGTPYRYGGMSKAGIDCSAFIQQILKSVFGIAIPRTARDQHKSSVLLKREELNEGDLVFFNTRGGVSHVGMYLQNGKFIHASVSNGVSISNLNDNYWTKRFIAGGRFDN